ncbi:MAG: MBL fold metallo-hydrolase [Verrucomicrobia bacterium]|nr:MBL fold metallo-hydrolase [Verrucomicrobiota bacterium]
MIHTLDLRFQNTPGIIAAFLIESGRDLALIETGPASTLPVLLELIKARGFAPEAIKQVFVTHVHLDHAGAAGWWAQQGATVYVHSRGAQHLIAPEKLIASARRVYGDKFDSLWGDMIPAPADKIITLADGDTVKIGKMKITALDTPGHARHHLAYVCEGACFTGDVAGVRLQGCDYLSVAAAPPQFDPVAYLDSITRLHDANFQRLYLTHFGEVTEVSSHLTRYARRVGLVTDAVKSLMDHQLAGDNLRAAYTKLEHDTAMEIGVSEVDWLRYELANFTGISAEGIALFHEKNPQA